MNIDDAGGSRYACSVSKFSWKETAYNKWNGREVKMGYGYSMRTERNREMKVLW